MAKRFELHLEGMDAPAGLIDADRLVEIVKGLQEMATRLGRIETDSAERGRPSKNLDRVASLRIGLEKGSTTIIAERDVSDGALGLDLSDEEAVDTKFVALMESIGADERPDWVTDSVASAADDLVNALQRAAPKVEFKVDGASKKSFETKALRRETWKTSAPAPQEAEVTFTGRLFAVNLNTHYFQMQDDVGNKVALPKVLDGAVAGKLVGSYVTVTGAPGVDSQGKLSQITEASVELTPDPLGDHALPPSASLEEILAGAPGPDPDGGIALSEDEAEAFLQAVRA